MIYGIGADIVRVARIKRDIERYGDRFAARILTPNEYQEYRDTHKPAHFLAKRFAAKEAITKALGVGFNAGIGMRQIGVGHDRRGKPLVEFFGQADDYRCKLGVRGSHISISDEEEYAIAFVVLLVD